VESGLAELGDVMLSVLMKVNAPTAVGSSALLAHLSRISNSLTLQSSDDLMYTIELHLATDG
jgi:hypothetical protein